MLSLVKGNGSFDRRLVSHSLEALSPLLEFEGLVDDAMHLDLATVEVVDSCRD